MLITLKHKDVWPQVIWAGKRRTWLRLANSTVEDGHHACRGHSFRLQNLPLPLNLHIANLTGWMLFTMRIFLMRKKCVHAGVLSSTRRACCVTPRAEMLRCVICGQKGSLSHLACKKKATTQPPKTVLLSNSFSEPVWIPFSVIQGTSECRLTLSSKLFHKMNAGGMDHVAPDQAGNQDEFGSSWWWWWWWWWCR